MITLVSYPRSGNTFLRNVLFEVYGIPSSTYHTEAHGPDQGWEEASVVKTHLLPDQLPAQLKERPVVYLVRDGRDVVVSMAHHRKDLYALESDVLENMEEVIYAAEGSHFGGWSAHVESWWRKADLIIRFEDLISDPIAQCERMATWLDLSRRDVSRLPSFEALKHGEPEYGSGKGLPVQGLAQRWFRRGKVGAWKDEMPLSHQHLFWHLHGEVSELIGYQHDGSLVTNPLVNRKPAKSMRLLVEAHKLNDPFLDGIGRYVHDTLRVLKEWSPKAIEIDVMLDGGIVPLSSLSFEQEQLKGSVWTAIKALIRRILPKEWVNRLALYFSAWKIQRSRQGVLEKEKTYDAVWLPLPQNTFHVDSIKTDHWWCTIHDLSHSSHPKYHTEANVQLTEAGIRWLKERGARYISVSHTTQQALKTIGISSVCIHEAVDRKQFYPIGNAHLKRWVQSQYNLPEGQFLLSVCTLEPRKNLLNLIDAYSRFPEDIREQHPLVLVGRKGWEWKAIHQKGIRLEHVHFIGFVRDEHLATIYTLAHRFIYPSIFEGFGLPILEAQACGTPVLCSSTSSLPEVAGDAAIYFDPEDVRSIQDAILKSLQGEEEQDWSEKSMRNTWRFSWKRSALLSLRAVVED